MFFLGKIRYALLFLGLALSAVSGLSAQSGEIRPLRVQLYYWFHSNSSYIPTWENENEKREKRIMAPITLWYQQGDVYQSIEVRPGQRSKIITVPAGKNIVFYKIDPASVETMPANEVLTVAVPPMVQQGLIMIRDGNLTRMDMIDTSDARIPKGSIRFSNQSTTKAVVKFGDQILPLDPAASVVARPKASIKKDDDPRVPLMMARLEKDGQWQIFYSSNLLVNPDERILVMLHPTGTNGTTLSPQFLDIPN